MKNQLMAAVNHLASEKGLPREVILEAIEAALASAYRRKYGMPSGSVQARVDPESGEMLIYVEKKVVQKVTDPRVQLSLAEAQAIDPQAEIGSVILVDSTPADFGRIAAQTAKQVIMQRIREAERETTYEHFAEQEGEIVVGRVQRYVAQTGDVIVNLEHSEAVLTKEEQLPNERYRRDSRISAYLMEVRKGNRGAVLKLSRRHRNMLRRLLEQEVPEISKGIVEIKALAREPGYRSKVAVAALQPGVEPVGCCVGMRGTRIQNIVNELSGEKIDVIAWSPDIRTFIKNALSPAKPLAVLLQEGNNGRTAVVVVPDKQLSLAIGKEGQNARLAAKLTGWRIDIKGETEARAEGLIELAEEQLRRETSAVEQKKRALWETTQAILEGREAIGAEVTAEAAEAAPAIEGEAEAQALEAAVVPEAEARPETVAEVPVPAEPAALEKPVAIEEPEAEEAIEVAEAAEITPAAEELAEEEAEGEWEEIEDYEDFDYPAYEEDEDEEDTRRKDSRRKKKDKDRRKRQRLVYDEELGETIAIRRRKQQPDDWGGYDGFA
ncbi:MAG: transcription termination factor NusA [Anaerolineae bacterium]|nr:transcription termination factor NusA [Anaerolineae bacterium]